MDFFLLRRYNARMEHCQKTRLALAPLLCVAVLAASAKSPARRAVTFTDDLGRTVEVKSAESAAVLQGSLASLWILAGGTVRAATSDCFSEPPALTREQAERLNGAWRTDGFFAHEKGIFSYVGAHQERAMDAGTMMSPNAERIIVSGADFAILSANIAGHKKILPLLENVGIACAFFSYDDFASFVRIMRILTDITGRSDLYERNVLAQIGEVERLAAAARAKTPPAVLALRASGANVKAKSSESLAAAAMLKHLNCANIADTDGAYKENLSMEKIIADDPDFIFVTTMGASEEKALRFMEETLLTNPAWNELKAVKSGNYFILPRELFHFKPGTRWSESYRVLFSVLYGDHAAAR